MGGSGEGRGNPAGVNSVFHSGIVFQRREGGDLFTSALSASGINCFSTTDGIGHIITYNIVQGGIAPWHHL
jgi:hypothetical protein